MKKNKDIEMVINKKNIFRLIWKGLNIFIFLALIYTGVMMLVLRNANTAIDIIFAASLFILFNKVESMSLRIQKLELEELKP